MRRYDRHFDRYVHHNKCEGGHAVEEIDGNTYCLGLLDMYYDGVVYIEECKDCPRLIENNLKNINAWLTLQDSLKSYERIRHQKENKT